MPELSHEYLEILTRSRVEEAVLKERRHILREWMRLRGKPGYTSDNLMAFIFDGWDNVLVEMERAHQEDKASEQD